MRVQLLEQARRRARRMYGTDAEIMHKQRGGRTQWWVKNGTGTVLAADTLRGLYDEMNPVLPEHRPLNAKQVAVILDVSPKTVPGLVKRGLKVAESVPGRGGMNRRFRLEDVEAFAASHKVSRQKPFARRTLRTKQVKMNGVPRHGGAQVTATIGETVRRRLAVFVNKYNRAPFNVTVGSVIESALARELDRLEKGMGVGYS